MIQSRWEDKTAKKFTRQQLRKNVSVDTALRVYTSRLIGMDRDLVMHGGGNTSCKTTERDIFGKEIETIRVKGSGWDLQTIEADGLPALKLLPLLGLRNLVHLSDEEMVNFQRSTLLDQNAPNPSIETLLHAFLPHKFVDHTHATAFLSLANLPNCADYMTEIFGNKLALVPFIMPGFELAKVAAEIHDQNPEVEGLLLAKHGHFTWGSTAKASYERVIKHTRAVERWFEKKKESKKFVVRKLNSNQQIERINAIKHALNVVSTDKNRSFVLDIIDDVKTSAKMNALISEGIVDRGVATPDHVIRIKPDPIIFRESMFRNGVEELKKEVRNFIGKYEKYFQENAAKAADKKLMLDPFPKLAWVEGLGLIGIGASKSESKVITDIAVQNVRVMNECEKVGGFFPVTKEELFQMEYWSLEQAKLGKNKKGKLQGKVVIITGAGGTIGKAIVKEFVDAGAEVIAVDNNQKSLENSDFSKNVLKIRTDITSSSEVDKLIKKIVKNYGGIDILISNAGTAPQGAMLDLNERTIRQSFEINFFAHVNLATKVAKVFLAQKSEGQIIFNITKQAVNPGKNFGAYGLPKSALLFLTKQLALELGKDGIRVNGVNADRIRSGILSDKIISDRAQSRGLDEREYMRGNLLGKEVCANHVANAFMSLALSQRTTGHVMTVDGGNIEASLR